jgi:uncharacterized protein YjiS (DUF1127 family)
LQCSKRAERPPPKALRAAVFAEDIRMKDLTQKYKAWRTERQRRLKLVRELSAYSDRDLLELGFSRHDFPAIINGTYRR